MSLLADLANMDLPFPNTDYLVRREYLQYHRAQVIEFMKAVLEGMRVIKANRSLGIQMIQKYLKMNNAEEAGIAYDYYVGQHMGEIPDVPSRAALSEASSKLPGRETVLRRKASDWWIVRFWRRSSRVASLRRFTNKIQVT